MNHLKGTRVYLCGAVEVATDPNNWRNTITPLLHRMGITVLNPMVKPSWVPGIDAPMQRQMKEDLLNPKPDTDFAKIESVNAAIRAYCLALVRMCDFMIVKIDKTFTVGTWEEVTVSVAKPHFLISENDIPSMWLLDQLKMYKPHDRHLYCHRDVQSCANTLHLINSGAPGYEPTTLDPMRWISVRHHEGI